MKVPTNGHVTCPACGESLPVGLVATSDRTRPGELRLHVASSTWADVTTHLWAHEQATSEERP